MREKNGLQTVIRYLSDGIVLIALAWLVVYCFLSQVTISGHSMEPRLSSGNLVLVDTLRYKLLPPRRMDIVAFRRSDNTENVKRVIGLPGEIVVIQSGHIYIDGVLLDRPEISDIALPGIAQKPVELSEDEYFLIGDNTDSSEDSRFENVGNVRRSQIYGRLWLRVLPLSRLELL